jgi:molybdate transport system regulatory protein
MPNKQKDKKMELSGSLWLHKEHHKFLGGDRMALLEQIDELGTITKAAKAIGVSYKTAWDLVNMINNMADKPLVDRAAGGKGGGGTTLTSEGKRVLKEFQIIQEEHNKFLDSLTDRLGNADYLYQFLRRISMKVSARNVFAGTVTSITKGAVNAEVILELKGDTRIAATVTNGAVESLDLQVGKNAYAIVKASSVIVADDLQGTKISARNILAGTITKIIEGPVNTEVDIEVGAGNTVSAVITHGSSVALGLSVGSKACAIFKASSVILGVS